MKTPNVFRKCGIWSFIKNFVYRTWLWYNMDIEVLYLLLESFGEGSV